MEKVIKFLGGQQNGSPKTGVFEVPLLLKNIILLLLSFGSITFTAGTYFSQARDIPKRMLVLEADCKKSEAQQATVLAKLDSLGTDVRELRSYMMRGR